MKLLCFVLSVGKKLFYFITQITVTTSQISILPPFCERNIINQLQESITPNFDKSNDEIWDMNIPPIQFFWY